MLIVNVLPEKNLAVALVGNIEAGAVSDSLQIDLSSNATKWVSFEDTESLFSGSVALEMFVLHLMTTVNAKVSQLLSKPICSKGLSELAGELPHAIELQFNLSDIMSLMDSVGRLFVNVTKAKEMVSVVKVDQSESVLFGNSDWITDNPPVVVG